MNTKVKREKPKARRELTTDEIRELEKKAGFALEPLLYVHGVAHARGMAVLFRRWADLCERWAALKENSQPDEARN
jgi:hypothetical protein